MTTHTLTDRVGLNVVLKVGRKENAVAVVHLRGSRGTGSARGEETRATRRACTAGELSRRAQHHLKAEEGRVLKQRRPQVASRWPRIDQKQRRVAQCGRVSRGKVHDA